jgi:hypothetical protein
MKYSGFQQVQKQAFKVESTWPSELLSDFNPLLNKSSGFLQYTQGQVCSHILYEHTASNFSVTELVPIDTQVTGRGKCANAELGHYTKQNNPDNYNFITPTMNAYTYIQNKSFLYCLTSPWGKD